MLHLAEGAAYNRIECARAARRFPMILEEIGDGALTLTAVRLLSSHLTPDNHRAVLASARYTSKRDIERIVAALHPAPPATAFVRKLSAPRASVEVATGLGGWSALAPPLPVAAAAPVRGPVASARSSTALGPGEPIPSAPSSLSAVKPLTPDSYKIQFKISQEVHEKLRRAQDLLRHAIPDGSLAEIFDRGVSLLLADLERRRCAAAVTPRPSKQDAPRSRHIAAAVRREVWKRDEGRCAYVGKNGRCRESGFLELHHVGPYAAGGERTVTNIELRCRAHNGYEASLFFGRQEHDIVREPPPPWPWGGT